MSVIKVEGRVSPCSSENSQSLWDTCGSLLDCHIENKSGGAPSFVFGEEGIKQGNPELNLWGGNGEL